MRIGVRCVCVCACFCSFCSCSDSHVDVVCVRERESHRVNGEFLKRSEHFHVGITELDHFLFSPGDEAISMLSLRKMRVIKLHERGSQ